MSLTRDDWLTALREAGLEQTDDDDRAVTVREFAAMFDCGREAAQGRLTALVSAGKAIRCVKRLRDASGRWQRVPAFRLER